MSENTALRVQNPPSETTHALPNIYMAITQALANAANNAVNAQQQSFTSMLAATTMGAEVIYTTDTPATTVGSQQILQTQAELEEAMKALLITPSATIVEGGDVAAQYENFVAGINAIMQAFAASLNLLGENAYLEMLRIIQLAAIASTLAALIKSPEQADSYERVLAMIKNLR